MLSPEQEQQLSQRLEALQRASSRQLVVATIPSLQDLPIEDYGYQLGRHWRLGQGGINNGVLLIVAPNEKKVRIEVGYGLEPVLTDALSTRIIQDTILPRFRDRDFPGGIAAGADAIVAQLQAPPDVAEQRALEAARAQAERGGRGERRGDGSWPLIFWVVVALFMIVPLFRSGFSGFGGRHYRRGRRGWGGPVILWGPGWGSGGWGGGWGGSSRGGGWGGGGGGGSSWGGGGGFSGGGGSFGGGGASGGW